MSTKERQWIPSEFPSLMPSTIPSDTPSVGPSESVEPSFEPSDIPSESPSESSAPSKSGKASKASQKSPTVSKAPKSPKSVKSVALEFDVDGTILRIQNGVSNTVVLTDCSAPDAYCFLWQQYGKYLKEADDYLTIEGGNLVFTAYVSDPTEWKIKKKEGCKMLYNQPEGGLRNVVCASPSNSNELVLVEWEYRDNSLDVPTGGTCCLEDGISSIE
ncbi:predicted protein [Chaetoceros tenuissimus]|uniref:Uncharacterized protein n=1 Tax=Chaetoceros tenuissimus TaxID=426638 RepID=A0AAD3CX90_9STRA|nr:predicted protein [Chaetoceros tenuissimus]